jgi:hypothetical protein
MKRTNKDDYETCGGIDRVSRGALIFVTAFSRTFRQPQIIKAHDWQTEIKCFACMDAVIRLIPFEPRMDVPDIWKAKNRIAVILIFIIVSIA